MDISVDQENSLLRESFNKDLSPSIYFDDSVGPGRYNVPSIVPEGPAYSFGHADRLQTPVNQRRLVYLSMTPEKQHNILNGHGHHTGSNSVPPDSFRHNLLFNLNDPPGPGKYEVSSTLYNNDFKIKGKRKDLKENGYPAPVSP